MFQRLKASEAPKKLLAIIMAFATIAGTTPAMANSFSSEKTATPIKHIVVIFQENISFDHYFGTYPNATNPKGEPRFIARPGTPTVNGLTFVLQNNNPNLNPQNGSGATNPFRLDRSEAATSDQDHDYNDEQKAFHAGLMDLFPLSVGTAGPPPNAPSGITGTTGLTMGYFDGNTVTAMWNYAQNFAMSDNSFGTTFGPSTPGVLNLVSGQTNGVISTLNGTGDEVSDGNGGLTMISDADPQGDMCASPTRAQGSMGGKNIGNLLSAAGVSWGSFMGGFDLTITNANGTTGCKRSTVSAVTGVNEADYTAHHAFFQYHASTANPMHTRPKNVAEIGHDGQANHNYDLNDFYTAVKAGNMPAVSFIKAQSFEDGHAGYSDPLDEQTFVVNLINFLETTQDWSSTAVVIAYDDSDGWYDHQIGPIVNQSTSSQDFLTGTGNCGDGTMTALAGISSEHAQGRCGYGPRLPLMVISPWAKENFVDHTVTDQTSIIHFIEDNWLGGERIGGGSFDAVSNSITNMLDFSHFRFFDGHLFLNPSTGEPLF